MMDLVLIGAHGVGKTTTAGVLSRRQDLPYRPEIGRQLAEDPRWRPADRDASGVQHAFDAEVMRLELGRDRRDRHLPGRVIETWHPGNLAYAALRSPAVAARYMAMAAASARRRPALVQPLHAAAATLRLRKSEPGSLAFFRRVARDAERLALALGLTLLPRVVVDGLAPAEVADAVARNWQQAAVKGGAR